MTITLPDEWRERLESGAKRAGFASVQEYLLDLVEDAEAQDEYLASQPGPPEISFRTREELERLLDEGMNSGPGVTADAAFWEQMRQKIQNGTLRRAGPKP